MSQRRHTSTRTLSQRPHLDQLRRQAKELFEAYTGGDANAAAELHALARSFAASQHSDNYNGWDLNLRDSAHFERGFFSGISGQLPMLSGASLLLMILVCLNLASLLGQQAARKKREVAIRAALGATSRRIALQVLV